MQLLDNEFFDDKGALQKMAYKFASPTTQAMLLFKAEHELAMGGPLIGKAALVPESGTLIRLEGLFSDEVLWHVNGQFVAVAKWATSRGRHEKHKVCILDAQNLQVGEFEDLMFVKHFTQFKDDTIACEYYERPQVTSLFVGQVKDLRFASLRDKNAA